MCKSHRGGAVRVMPSLLMRVQEFRIWGISKLLLPVCLVFKAYSVEVMLSGEKNIKSNMQRLFRG